MLLRAEPQGVLARRYRILEDDREVGRLALGPFRRKLTLEAEGARYRIRREGLFGDFVLESDDEIRPRELARAEGGGPLSRSFRVRAGDRMLTLRGNPPFHWSVTLLHGERRVGSAKRAGWFGRSGRFDFPAELTLETRLFLATLAIVVWRRARAAARS
jgi:hypothetical protein